MGAETVIPVELQDLHKTLNGRGWHFDEKVIFSVVDGALFRPAAHQTQHCRRRFCVR